MAGCNGWDDDSEFEIGTKAAFFLSPDPSGGLQLIRVDADGYSTMWNESVGVPSASLSDVDFRDNMLWLSNGNEKSIRQVDPTDGKVERQFNGLPIAPHVISVGLEQILIADTFARSVAFVRIKDGESFVVKTGIKARRCINNAHRFYLVHATDSVTIYDEKALHPRGYASFGAYVDDIMFDKYKNIRVVSHDSAQQYVGIIGANYEAVAVPNYPVGFKKIEYTPYFFARFGSEITQDLKLDDMILQTLQLDPLLDSLDDFDTDFFSGIVYGKRQDSLLRYDYARDSVLGTEYFPYEIIRGYYQYGNNP